MTATIPFETITVGNEASRWLAAPIPVALSYDGSRVLAGSFKTVQLWNRASQTELFSHEFERDVHSAHFSTDGKRVLIGAADGLRVFSCDTFELLDHRPEINERILLSPDERLIAELLFGRIWDAKSSQKIRNIYWDVKYVAAVGFSPDGKHLFAAEDEGAIHIWNLETGMKQAKWQAVSWIAAASFSPDGRRAVIGECWPCIIDMATQENLGKVPWDASKRLKNVKFAPDSRHFATASSDHVVRYWDAETRTVVAELSHDGSEVGSLTFSGDGRFLAAGLSECRLRLWSIP